MFSALDATLQRNPQGAALCARRYDRGGGLAAWDVPELVADLPTQLGSGRLPQADAAYVEVGVGCWGGGYKRCCP